MLKILSSLFALLITVSCAFGAASDYKVDNLGKIYGYDIRIRDTDSSHYLIFKAGSNLTADRTFTITTGDADVNLSFPLSIGLGGTGLITIPAGYIPFGAGVSPLASSAKLTWDDTNNKIRFYKDAGHYMTIDHKEIYVRSGDLSLNSNYISTPLGYGFLGLGTTADMTVSLWVSNRTKGSGEQVSGYFTTTFSNDADVPNAVYGIWISPILDTSSAYTSTAIGLKISDFSVVSAPAVSYLHGIQIAKLTAGELGNYQISLGDASGFYESSYTAGTQTGNLRFILPVTNGTAGQALVTDGGTPTTTLSWSSVAQTHAMLSATHTDSTAAGVVRGDIITGQGASPNTKWARKAKGSQSTQLRMGADDPQWTKSIINVMDYGAVGDANASTCVGTDDTAAINAALTAAPIGSTVFMPNGVYKITDPLIFADKNLVGDGRGTIICASGLSATEDAIYVSPTADFEYRSSVKNLYIYMNTGGRDGIRLISGDYPTIENVYIYKPGQDGIHCEAEDVTHWLENLYFTSVHVRDPGRHGFSFIVPEDRKLTYTSGSHEPTVGQTIYGQTSGSVIVVTYVDNSGGWGGSGTGIIGYTVTSGILTVGEHLHEGAGGSGNLVAIIETLMSSPFINVGTFTNLETRGVAGSGNHPLYFSVLQVDSSGGASVGGFNFIGGEFQTNNPTNIGASAVYFYSTDTSAPNFMNFIGCTFEDMGYAGGQTSYAFEGNKSGASRYLMLENPVFWHYNSGSINPYILDAVERTGNIITGSTIPVKVKSTSATNPSPATIVVSNSSGGTGIASGIEFNYFDALGNDTQNIARIMGNVQSGGGGDILFQTAASNTTAYATKMTLLRDGTLALGTNSLTMTGSLGATGARLTKGWFTDLQVTNAINGSVTTNANLTGPITSAGNATSVASQTGTGTKFVMDASPTLTGTVTMPAVTQTGAITFNNDVNLQGKTAGGVTKILMALGSTDSITIGYAAAGTIVLGDSASATDPIHIRVNSATKNITVDSADTCGTGYRCLRVPN